MLNICNKDTFKFMGNAPTFLEFFDDANSSHKKRRAKNLSELHQKWGPFLQLAAEEKDVIFGTAQKFFGPSYFDRALPYLEKVLKPRSRTQYGL